jgi:hypothetical protein
VFTIVIGVTRWSKLAGGWMGMRFAIEADAAINGWAASEVSGGSPR